MRLRRMSDHVRSQNWFAVALDFIIVVLGVLLALWATQWVSDRQAHRSAEIAAEAMDADLMLMAHGTMRRFSTQPCVVQAINRMDEAISVEDGAPFTPPSPAKVNINSDGVFQTYYPGGLWNYSTQSYDRAVATGALDHMDADRAANYAGAYQWVLALAEANDNEEVLISRLSMVELIEQMDAPTRLAIRRDLAELDGWNQGVLNAGRFLFDTMDRLGIEPTEEDRADWQAYNEAARRVRGDCVIDLPLDFTGAATGNSWSNEIDE